MEFTSEELCLHKQKPTSISRLRGEIIRCARVCSFVLRGGHVDNTMAKDNNRPANYLAVIEPPARSVYGVTTPASLVPETRLSHNMPRTDPVEKVQ